MASLDFDLVRHALETARASGMNEVELQVGSSSFTATLQKASVKKSATANTAGAEGSSEPTGPAITKIKSPGVGYFRTVLENLDLGSKVEAGQIVASVVALGISNDVFSTTSGVVTELHVKDGDAVDFGQVLATLESE